MSWDMLVTFRRKRKVSKVAKHITRVDNMTGYTRGRHLLDCGIHCPWYQAFLKYHRP